MRIVRSPDELADALSAARREAKAAFGDDSVFAERYVERPRHVEIQLLADAHGNVVALGERECSVQRRHQKVLEEAPSPALDADLRAQMSEAAVAFARAIGYRSAGTAEFMLDGRDFFFLELNGRIQVEHPVTELVTGVDLVREQLRIAQGERLEASNSLLQGHAVEVRLYAEDPRTFLPQGGRLAPTPPTSVRVDAGVEEGDEVNLAYDPLIAKLIARGSTRAEALERLHDALGRHRSRGRDHESAVPPLAGHASEAPGRRDDHGIPGREPASERAACSTPGPGLALAVAAEPARTARAIAARSRSGAGARL